MIALKRGNIGYNLDFEAFSWQQKKQHSGNMLLLDYRGKPFFDIGGNKNMCVRDPCLILIWRGTD
jgi:hypothetical protein